jgi:hypothetical protein
MKESILQQQVRNTLSVYGIFHFAVLNETAMMILKMIKPKISRKTRSTIVAYLKKMGMTPGIPDLCILANQTIYFMEFKIDDNKLSGVQQLVTMQLKNLGYEVAVARSYTEAMAILKKWRILP